MARIAPLTETKLAHLWKQVHEQDSEGFWGDLHQQSQALVKAMLEASLEEEMVYRLGAGRYGRHKTRRSWRNGYYYRDVLWDQGLITHLQVPRARGKVEPSQILERYRHRQGQINQLVKDMFLAGVSTRRVGEVLEPVLGEAISASSVSNILAALDREVAKFLARRLEDHFVYLLLDGLTLKVKSASGVVKKLVLVAYGIDGQGRRQIISFQVATAESEAQWEAFLNHLFQNGLEGKNLSLVVTDGCPGLTSALERVYPYVARQRCWAHKLRNVAQRLPRRLQKDCLKGAKDIYQAGTQRQARALFGQWASQWRSQVPQAVECIEKDLEELLAFLVCPQQDWKKIRTTNAIERSFREVRRRTRPMSCFNNQRSCQRIIYGVVSHLNTKWHHQRKKGSLTTHNS